MRLNRVGIPWAFLVASAVLAPSHSGGEEATSPNDAWPNDPVSWNQVQPLPPVHIELEEKLAPLPRVYFGPESSQPSEFPFVTMRAVEEEDGGVPLPAPVHAKLEEKLAPLPRVYFGPGSSQPSEFPFVTMRAVEEEDGGVPLPAPVHAKLEEMLAPLPPVFSGPESLHPSEFPFVTMRTFEKEDNDVSLPVPVHTEAQFPPLPVYAEAEFPPLPAYAEVESPPLPVYAEAEFPPLLVYAEAESPPLPAYAEVESPPLPVDESELPFGSPDGPVEPPSFCDHLGEECVTECSICGSLPTWSIQADSLLLWRTRSRDIRIVEDGAGAEPRGQRTTLLTTNTLNHDPEWGPRVTLGRRLKWDEKLEFTYFELNDWTSQEALSGANLDVPFTSDLTVDFDAAQLVSARYVSGIQNAEINWMSDNRWDLNQSAGFPWHYYTDFLVGFRYFRLSEEFDLASTAAGQTSNYQIDTMNNMYGGQVGLIAGTYRSAFVSWKLVAKAGIYSNLGRQSTLLRDVNNSVVLRNSTTRDKEVAFLGEILAEFTYDIHPNAVLTAGYSVVWVDGVALAPEQLDFSTALSSGSSLNQNGNAVFQGAFAGLRVTF